jgi:hypothetical protein
MDSKKAEALLKKYWDGKSDLKEEAEMRKHFSASKAEGDISADHFKYLNQKGVQNPLGDSFNEEIVNLFSNEKSKLKQKNVAIKYWYVAASLALMISISIIFKNEFTKVDKVEHVVKVDTYEDPAKAFEETKRALLMISSKLNQSGEYATKFSKFEESQKNLKQN